MGETKDILTGLDRYEEFLKKLELQIGKMKNGEMEGYRIAIIYTDIKHFKYIPILNDKHISFIFLCKLDSRNKLLCIVHQGHTNA